MKGQKNKKEQIRHKYFLRFHNKYIKNKRMEEIIMANLIKSKTVVLDRRTSENSSLESGDFVKCCNCGRTMLVNIGTGACPECDEKSLIWADEENEEVSDIFFHCSEDYMLADTEN